MSVIRRFAPLLAITALLALIGLGGATLAHNNQSPDIDPATATLNVDPAPLTVTSTAPPPAGESADDEGAPETVPAEQPEVEGAEEQPPAPAPAPAPAPVPVPAPAPAPQPPLYYQDFDDDDWDDDDWDDDWDDWDDDDWDDD